MFVSSQVKSELDIGTPRFLRTQPEQNLRVQKKNDKYDVTRSSCDSMGKASYSRSWLPSGTPIGGRLCTCCCVHFRSACHGTTQSPFSLQPYNEYTTPSGDGTKGTFTRQGQKRPHRPPGPGWVLVICPSSAFSIFRRQRILSSFAGQQTCHV